MVHHIKLDPGSSERFQRKFANQIMSTALCQNIVLLSSTCTLHIKLPTIVITSTLNKTSTYSDTNYNHATIYHARIHFSCIHHHYDAQEASSTHNRPGQQPSPPDCATISVLCWYQYGHQHRALPRLGTRFHPRSGGMEKLATLHRALLPQRLQAHD